MRWSFARGFEERGRLARTGRASRPTRRWSPGETPADCGRDVRAPLTDQRRGERTSRVHAVPVARMRFRRRDQRHPIIDLRPCLGVTRIGDDDNACVARPRRQQRAHIDERQIAIGEAPRADAAMSGERQQQRVAAAQARERKPQFIDERVGGAIDQHPLHAEAAGRGCGCEIARIDGRRMQPSGDAARNSGVQRDPTHPSTSIVTIGQLLPCGTFSSCLTGITGGSGGVDASR